MSQKMFMTGMLCLLIGGTAVWAGQYSSTNLISNGGAESGLLNWYYSATGVTISSTARTGVQSFQLSPSGSLAELRSLRTTVSSEEFLKFSFAYKAISGIAANGMMYVRSFSDANGTKFIGQDFYVLSPTNTSWTVVSDVVKTRSGAKVIDVVFDVNAVSGAYLIDDISLVRRAVKIDTTSNSFTNGDAESTPDFLNWYHSLDTTIAADSASAPGTRSFQLNPVPYGESQLRSLAVAVIPSETLRLIFAWKTSAGASVADGNDVALQIRFFNGSTYLSMQKIVLPFTSGSWQTITQEISSIPAAANSMDIVWDIYDYAASGVFRIDDIVLNRQQYAYSVPSLVSNGDAESATDFLSWFHNSNMAMCRTDSASTGTSSFQANPLVGTAGTANGSQLRSLIVPVNTGDPLQINYSWKSLTGATTSSRGTHVQIRFWTNATSYSYVGGYEYDIPLTGNAWQNFSHKVRALTPYMDVVWNTNLFGAASGTFRVDNISVYKGSQLFSLNFEDFAYFGTDWTINGFGAGNIVDNFEAYTNQGAMEAFWGTSSGSYADRGISTITLLTNPADVHSGSKALRWTYDNTTSSYTRVWSEFNMLLASPLDLSKFAQMRIWVNRHPSNSQEELMYLKFYNGAVDSAHIMASCEVLTQANGSTYSPTGWAEWVINLGSLTFSNGAASVADLTNVQGFFFGAVGDVATSGKGTGTIDFDDISLTGCLTPPTWDLNGDCVVNFMDCEKFVESWLK